MGTGVVAFNLAPHKAILCDINPHLINFYNSVSNGMITPYVVREYLIKEGRYLSEKGESHYYEIRERFNKTQHPLDFLFLNRAGFNGMIRFNRKGQFNIPFCRKPQRFAKAYITKIVNQVSKISEIIKSNDFKFICQGFEETIADAHEDDLIYCDPPYIGRHVDYFNGWDAQQEELLYKHLSKSKSNFILSTWHHNQYRKNEYIEKFWGKYNIFTRDHYYHVGGNEKNRNSMVEALIFNYETSVFKIENEDECNTDEYFELIKLTEY
jgi:DNA adenine methylase